MRHTRSTIPALFALAALAAGAGAASAYDDDDEVIPCADFISSGADDDPVEGHLIGTEDVTMTVSGGGSVSADARVIDVSAGGSVEKTVEYEIGYYRVDGETYVIDCRSYTLIKKL